MPSSLQYRASEAVMADLPHPGSPVSQKKFRLSEETSLTQARMSARMSTRVSSSHGGLPWSSYAVRRRAISGLSVFSGVVRLKVPVPWDGPIFCPENKDVSQIRRGRELSNWNLTNWHFIYLLIVRTSVKISSTPIATLISCIAWKWMLCQITNLKSVNIPRRAPSLLWVSPWIIWFRLKSRDHSQETSTFYHSAQAAQQRQNRVWNWSRTNLAHPHLQISLIKFLFHV